MAGRARAELPTLPAQDFNTLAAAEDEGETIELASGILAAGFGSVLHATSQEEARYYICGVYVEPSSSAINFTATDGHRLASLKITAGVPSFSGIEPFIVPRGVLRDYVKF